MIKLLNKFLRNLIYNQYFFIKLIVLIALLKLVQSFWTPQFNQGHQVIVIFKTGHILETQSTVPRQVVIDSQFSIVVQFAPQVFIQTSCIDWYQTLFGGFIGRVSSITTTSINYDKQLKGFKIISIAVARSSLFELHFYWIAINDPGGEREVQYKIDHNLEDATNGIISLIGIKHSAYSSIIKIDIEEITQSITIVTRSYLQSELKFIKFNVLLGTSQSLWSSPKQALINAQNHPFVSRGEGECDLQMTINRPQILGNYQLIPLIALRGYDINNAANIRLKYTNVAFNVEKISHLFLQNKKQQQFNIYFDKQRLSNYILRVNFCNIKSLLLRSYFIYDLNYKAFDPYCAELFSEWDFNGDTIIICDKVPDLQALEWSKPIRSISIPKYSILFLFGMVNYQGVKQSVIQTQQCDEFRNIQSANFQPTVSNIKLNSIVNAIIKEQFSKQLKDIPFEIISISTCPNIIIKLKAPNYFGGAVKEITTSQSCMISYKFPKYQANQ